MLLSDKQRTHIKFTEAVVFIAALEKVVVEQ